MLNIPSSYYDLHLILSLAFEINSHIHFQEDLWMGITKQRMFVTPAEFPSPDCRGFLLKLDGTSKSWKRRYCILADSCLLLYTDFDAQSALGKKISKISK